MNLSCVSESKRLQGGALASDAVLESVMIIRLATRAMVEVVCPKYIILCISAYRVVRRKNSLYFLSLKLEIFARRYLSDPQQLPTIEQGRLEREREDILTHCGV